MKINQDIYIGWSRGNRSVCIFDFSQLNFTCFSPIFYQKIHDEIVYKNKLKYLISNVPMKHGTKDMMKFQYVEPSERFLSEKNHAIYYRFTNKKTDEIKLFSTIIFGLFRSIE